MIEFRSISKTFPDGTTAVDDFSLQLPSHQTTVFVGSSALCLPTGRSMPPRSNGSRAG